MKTNTLNLIERSLTRLLAGQTTHGPIGAEESETISPQIAQAVSMLERACEDMLARARASFENTGRRVEGTVIGNIKSALTPFRNSPLYSSLSNGDKMIVLKTVEQYYEAYYEILRARDDTTPWGKYQREIYDWLVISLAVAYKRLSKL
jgi:hypothetical protein